MLKSYMGYPDQYLLRGVFMAIRVRMILTTGILALLCLAQSSFAQDYFKGLYLVHEKVFNPASFSLLMDGLEDPSPKAFLYKGDGGGCKVALEKPGAWRGMVDIGSEASSNLPQIALRADDVVRVEYSGGNDPNSLGQVWALLGVGYYGGGGIPSAPGTTIICDGKRRFYDFLVPKEDAGKSLTDLYVTVRSPGPGGGEFTVYSAGVYRKPVNNRINADAILKTPPVHDVKVANNRGAMSIMIDGKPITGLGWATMINHNVGDEHLKVMVGDSNFKCARLMMTLGQSELGYYPATWLGPDWFDWSYLDTQVGRLLQANPQTKIILQVDLNGTLWWVRMHPEAAGINPKGMIPDYLSPEWRRDCRGAIRQMIAHIQTSPYAESIIGYQLMNGSTLDCNYEVNTSTPRALQRFTKFLKEKYKTVGVLRKAWNDSVVTFESAKPLMQQDKQANPDPNDPYALLLAPGENKRIADSQDFYTLTYDEVILDFCKFVKEATHNRVVTGARYGNLLSEGWGPISLGGGRIKRYLENPHFDYFEQWEPYPGRDIGYLGSGAPILPPQGLADFNKMIVLQNDVRPHTGPDMGYGATQNADETIVLQRRVFMNSMVLGQSPYLWQMSYQYGVPELMALWNEQVNIFDRMIHSDRRTGAEIAYVFDSDYAKYLGWDPVKSDPTRGFSLLGYPRYLWARAGVPYDMILLEKLNQRKNYKVYVFFLTIGLDAAQRKMIDQVVKKDGKMAIFLWADGFIDNAGMFNSKAMSQLVDMNISASKKARNWKMSPSKWFIDKTGIKPDTRMGTLINNEPCEPLADLNTYAPSFTVNDPSAKAIALYEGTRDVGIAIKRNKSWSTIYCASMNLVPSIVRYAFKQTGGFQYTNTDDICYINNSFIGLHTKQTGTIKVKLPKASALYDVYNDKELPVATSFDIPVEQFQTYMFYRGTKRQWDGLKKMD
jgi:hypothetical protein